MRGYFGIGIENLKTGMNLGTLWRSAGILGASYIFVIGERYKRQTSDTRRTERHIPLYNFDDFDHFHKSMPYDCPLIGVEITDKAKPIAEFHHPERCTYLLGAEDIGLSKSAIDACRTIVQLPGEYCLNVAVAGSLVMYDRIMKRSV